MELKDVISLAEAAEELGLGASTLRHQAQDGRLEARVVGKTWITTRQEVERYRLEILGQKGRAREATVLFEMPFWTELQPNGTLRVLGFPVTPPSEREAVEDVIRDGLAKGLDTTRDLVALLRADPRTSDSIFSSGERPAWIGIGRVVPKGELGD